MRQQNLDPSCGLSTSLCHTNNNAFLILHKSMKTSHQLPDPMPVLTRKDVAKLVGGSPKTIKRDVLTRLMAEIEKERPRTKKSKGG